MKLFAFLFFLTALASPIPDAQRRSTYGAWDMLGDVYNAAAYAASAAYKYVVKPVGSGLFYGSEYLYNILSGTDTEQNVSIYAISDRGDVKTLYNNGHWSDDELLNEDGVVFISEPNDPETFIPIPRDDLDKLHEIQMMGFDEAQKAKDYEGEYEYFGTTETISTTTAIETTTPKKKKKKKKDKTNDSWLGWASNWW